MGALSGPARLRAEKLEEMPTCHAVVADRSHHSARPHSYASPLAPGVVSAARSASPRWAAGMAAPTQQQHAAAPAQRLTTPWFSLADVPKRLSRPFAHPGGPAVVSGATASKRLKCARSTASSAAAAATPPAPAAAAAAALTLLPHVLAAGLAPSTTRRPWRWRSWAPLWTPDWQTCRRRCAHACSWPGMQCMGTESSVGSCCW